MPKLQELTNTQINNHIDKIQYLADERGCSSEDMIRLKALMKEKKKRMAKQIRIKTNKRLSLPNKKIKSKKRKLDPVGKVRNPWVVVLLTLITLGIYGIFYFYKTGSEIHLYRKTGLGGISILLITLFPFTTIITFFLLPSYIKQMHLEKGEDCSLDWYYGFLAFIPFGTFVNIILMQNCLNEFWLKQSKKI